MVYYFVFSCILYLQSYLTLIVHQCLSYKLQICMIFQGENISLWNICVTNYYGYVPLVVSTSQFFPHSWLITDFVTRLIRRVPLVEQKLLILREHLCSFSVFSWVRVTRSLVLFLCFIDRCLSFCTFSFGDCVVCSSSDYDYPFGEFSEFSRLKKAIPKEWCVLLSEEKSVKTTINIKKKKILFLLAGGLSLIN